MGKTVRYGVDAKKKYNDGKVGRNRHIPKEWTYTKKDKTPVEEDRISEPEEVLCLEWDDELEDFVWIMKHPEYAN